MVFEPSVAVDTAIANYMRTHRRDLLKRLPQPEETWHLSDVDSMTHGDLLAWQSRGIVSKVREREQGERTFLWQTSEQRYTWLTEYSEYLGDEDTLALAD
jgi:hypothetical protein